MTNEQHPRFSESDAALTERRMDQGVWNGAMGAAAIEGSFPPAVDEEDHPRPKRTTPQRARRKPRPKPAETSGETVSRDMANRFALEHPVDPVQQHEINRRGLERLAPLRKQLEIDVKLRHIHERDEIEDPDYADRTARESELATNAILRATFERRNRTDA